MSDFARDCFAALGLFMVAITAAVVLCMIVVPALYTRLANRPHFTWRIRT